jgi:hypothetical protein
MLRRLLTRLYAHLLELYPYRFADEFGGEMADVFTQTLAGLDDSGPPIISMRLTMIRLFLREVWDFPHTYLNARRYHVSLGDGESPAGSVSYGEGEVTGTWAGRRTPWPAAILGALPFLLFGLAYLIEGITELGGHYGPVFDLLEGRFLAAPPYDPVIALTPPIAVYVVSVLGLFLGILKDFPRWSFAYLGMSVYFGGYYNNGTFINVDYGLGAWMPLIAAVLLGLLLNRSQKPLARLRQGAWNDWTRLSFSIYAFALPITSIIFFDDTDWGVYQLYGLVFDTVLFAAGAAAFLRLRTIFGRALALLAPVLILVGKGVLGGSWEGQFWPMMMFLTFYICFLFVPAAIGPLRQLSADS